MNNKKRSKLDIPMTALPPTAESGDSFRERQLLCAAELGAQEGVDKGRKGGVVTDQEK